MFCVAHIIYTWAASGISMKETGSEWISRVTSFATTSWFLNLDNKQKINAAKHMRQSHVEIKGYSVQSHL